ncbi:unnamed protein product [Prunus brigantina]
MAIRAEYVQEREFLRKELIDKKDRETMAMDTSHMSPETKKCWKLERRDVMRRRLFHDDGPSNTDCRLPHPGNPWQMANGWSCSKGSYCTSVRSASGIASPSLPSGPPPASASGGVVGSVEEDGEANINSLLGGMGGGMPLVSNRTTLPPSRQAQASCGEGFFNYLCISQCPTFGLLDQTIGNINANANAAELSVIGTVSVSGSRRQVFFGQAPSTTVNDPNSMAAAGPKWAQKTITLPPQRRGCHLITPQIVKEIGQELSHFNCGLAHLFLQHTTASLTINENVDSDVRDDTETFLNRIVPEGTSAPWKHTLEGSDDMLGHIKSLMFGCTLTVPITNGKLNMGPWQEINGETFADLPLRSCTRLQFLVLEYVNWGIWLCEHRDYPTGRKVVVTLNGI